jgi:hypothetical protein
MGKFSTDAAMQSYLILMHEVAIRIELVGHACDGSLNLTPPYAREYAYLQFRRICELIALGSIQLHGDLPSTQTQSIKNEWNAEKIMKILYKSHPHYFPQSIMREKTSKGWNITANCKPNALTLGEFKKLYSECGEVLHRGTIRALETIGTLTNTNYQKVIDWQRKIVDLMNEHIVIRNSGRSFYMISLRTDAGFPECSVLTINDAGELEVINRKLTINDIN